MTIAQVQALQLYSLVVNYVFLLLWFTVFACAHELLYKLHSRWFKLSTTTPTRCTTAQWQLTKSPLCSSI
jgi:hypothetical protein